MLNFIRTTLALSVLSLTGLAHASTADIVCVPTAGNFILDQGVDADKGAYQVRIDELTLRFGTDGSASAIAHTVHEYASDEIADLDQYDVMDEGTMSESGYAITASFDENDTFAQLVRSFAKPNELTGVIVFEEDFAFDVKCTQAL